MKTLFAYGAVAVAALALSSLSFAQAPVQEEDGFKAAAKENPTDKDKAKAGEAGGQKIQVQQVFRLSTLNGMPVRNTQGDDLGKIEDLVIELNRGDIRYAALSFGGFASVGDKLFAVPWKKLAFKFGEEDSYFIVDVTEDQLKRAPGFDQDRWPDVADPNWSKQVDAFYGASTTRDRTDRDAAETRKRDEDAAESRADEPKRTRETAKPGELVHDAVYRAENITGMEVKNDRGEDLGSIHELVIDIKAGKVRYAAVSFGGVLGLGDKLFAVPWNVLKFHHRGTDKHFVFNVSQDVLKDAKGFDENHWPNVGDPRWSHEVDETYRSSTEREARRPRPSDAEKRLTPEK